MEERVERRLAAILAADVVGYSRLMGADEPGTLTRLGHGLEKMLLAPMPSVFATPLVVSLFRVQFTRSAGPVTLGSRSKHNVAAL